jgi:hypothetical protein
MTSHGLERRGFGRSVCAARGGGHGEPSARYWPYWSYVTRAFATGPAPWTLSSSLDVPVVLVSGGDEYRVGKGYPVGPEIILQTADPVIAVQAAVELAEQWHAGVEVGSQDDPGAAEAPWSASVAGSGWVKFHRRP